MSTHDRQAKDKRNSLLKAAKNFAKVLDLFKNQVQITNLVIKNGELLSSLCSIRNTSHDTDVDHINIISNNNYINNDIRFCYYLTHLLMIFLGFLLLDFYSALF